MEDETILMFPNSGQKIVSLVNNSKFGKCIKKIQKNGDFISRINKEILFIIQKYIILRLQKQVV